MLPYFPFGEDAFKMTLGVQALFPDCLIEIDEERYRAELALKHELLRTAYADYFQAAPGSEALQWEAIELLLPNMARHFPQHFALNVEGKHWRWHNHLLATETVFTPGDPDSFSLPPLDWLGRQVQEDLLLLSGDAASGMPLVAGQLCFPNAWWLQEKLGKSFLDIHHEVPLFAERLGRSSSLLLERLKVDRPIWRVNWACKTTPHLNLIPRFAREALQSAGELTVENVGERCFLRIERQTLSRLPRTKGILFTIHTYQAPLAEVAQDAVHARYMAGVIRTTPGETLAYKGMAPFTQALLAYLETRY